MKKNMENSDGENLEYLKIENLYLCYTMGGFEKNCPVCGKKFTSLVEYTNHIGIDHKDISPEQILKLNKEDKWSFSSK